MAVHREGHARAESVRGEDGAAERAYLPEGTVLVGDLPILREFLVAIPKGAETLSATLHVTDSDQAPEGEGWELVRAGDLRIRLRFD